MDRRELVALTAVVLVVGLAIAAATLDSATFETGGAGGPAPDLGLSEGEGLGPTALLYLYVAIVIFAVFALFFAIRSDDLTPTHLLVVTAVLAGAALAVVGLLSISDARFSQDLLDSLSSAYGTGAEAPADADASGPPGGDGEAGSSAPGPLLTLVLLGLFAGFVAVGAVALRQVLHTPAPTEESAGSTDDSTGVGRAAGRAADQLEDRDLENPIYRAWVEMTRGLGVTDPQSMTPADFAEAGVRAGLDPTDVHTLTDLFRDVRYGSAEVTDSRIERATTTLRRIEARHVDDEHGDGGGGSA